MGWLSFFDAQNVFFSLWGYPVSYVEFTGVLTGFCSVFFAIRANLLTWYIGIVNVLCFAVLFFQVQLYADFILQLFYLAISIQGIFLWQKKQADSALATISPLTTHERWRQALLGAGLAGSLVLFGYGMPKVFAVFSVKPATYLWVDSLLSAASIVATLLMARKKLEAWLLWIVIDSCSIYLYLQKETYFVALQFLVFTLMAVDGYRQWKKSSQKAG